LQNIRTARFRRLYICELTDEIRIIDLTIAPQFRSKGFGTEILADILSKATKPVRIYLEDYNRSAKLFERLGFRVIRDEGIYRLWECASVRGKNLNAVA
jgi:ribosomal protein S18 acetylase RimI-like enzyme